MRAHRRTVRRVALEVAELSRAVATGAAALELSRRVLADLAGKPYVGDAAIAAAVAHRCADDAQRRALAAYLHLCRDLSLDAVATVFEVDRAAARRLVERGTGTTPITAGDDCRGWGLVAPRPDRTSAERQAGTGHLALCRRCRNKLRAHASLEHRVAAAGTATFGASVTAAVGRAFAGGHVAGSAAGALTGPIVALSTAAALTAGAGAFAITAHHGDVGSPAGVLRQHGHAPAGVRGSTAPGPQPVSTTAPTAGPVRRAPSGPTPDLRPSRQLPLTDLPAVPLPSVTAPALPLPTVSVSPLPLPLPSASLPVPVPTLNVPTLP